jgi:hypothetical protein
MRAVSGQQKLADLRQCWTGAARTGIGESQLA